MLLTRSACEYRRDCKLARLFNWDGFVEGDVEGDVAWLERVPNTLSLSWRFHILIRFREFYGYGSMITSWSHHDDT